MNRMSSPSVAEPAPAFAVDLLWIPLGAGGSPLVRWSGLAFEAIVARKERRARQRLFHSALEVYADGVRHVIEMTPVWGQPGVDRGVVREGPVGSKLLGRSRLFRYEVHRWLDGTIPDRASAEDSPQRLSTEAGAARAVLALAASFPTATWGRDEFLAGEMWNSNSLTSWLLARSGHDLEPLEPPAQGRAPGWGAGLVVAARAQGPDPRGLMPVGTSAQIHEAGGMNTTGIPAGSIVVGVDGSSYSDEALDWAVEQAALEQRPLTIVHTIEPVGFIAAGTYAGGGIDYGALLDQSQAAGKATLHKARTRALETLPAPAIHQVLSQADPRSTLLDLSQHATMIVLGSRGRGPIASLLLGSVSVSVSKHASCPVVVRRRVDPSLTTHGILVGVDGTEISLPAIEFAYRMASFRARPLVVLHCYWEDHERALVAESIAGMAEKFPDVNVEVRLAQGFADQHLVNASQNYELVVVGHHPITPLSDLIFGSVAPTVVEHAHGAVAVVPAAPAAPSSDA
ncbi:universal stress protein [Nocardioides sp.]|uniref:universal stress protein n=1 Tax=Nocardioides sp. TaxID=35761 RepID=UPI003D0C381E